MMLLLLLMMMAMAMPMTMKLFRRNVKYERIRQQQQQQQQLHIRYFMTKFLTENYRNDLVFTMANKTTFPSYGYFLEQGFTTWYVTHECTHAPTHAYCLHT